MSRTIAILTDFGYQDNYAGIMKGVIRTISPFADIIDINHGIPLGDIKVASINLESSYAYYPRNTIFLCVVDPGVGSSRRAIAVEADGRFFVAPDNGLLTPILNKGKVFQAVSLTNTNYHLYNPSHTFHGRDIFAPVAAHISMKVELHELGELIDIASLVTLDNDSKTVNGDFQGQIIHNDIYGNSITDITADWADKKKRSKDLSCRV
ncbi:MAG: SAM-dependent chlorinase/fluorinase [Candidatus Kapabacteria bacterium]|nr:SAM-dependent chlorinase/fluorinase [Candidatus Kapabacteria bacterium]